jgi:outer membrane protein assembly factor BamB
VGPDGTLYVSNGGGAVQAVDPADGGTRWSYSANASSDYESTPVLAADGTLRVFDYANFSYAVVGLDAGAKLPVNTSYQTRGKVVIAPGGTLFFASTTGTLVALGPAGNVLWSLYGETDDFTFPALGADGTIFTNTNTPDLYSIHPDGGAGWHAALDGGNMSSPVVAVDGTLRAFSYNELFALDSATGAVIWRKTADVNGINGIAVADDGSTVVAGASVVSVWDANGGLVTSIGDNCRGPTIDAHGDVYAVCGAEMTSFDKGLGTRWHLAVPGYLGNVTDHVVIGPGNVAYVATTDNVSKGAIDAFGGL